MSGWPELPPVVQPGSVFPSKPLLLVFFVLRYPMETFFNRSDAFLWSFVGPQIGRLSFLPLSQDHSFVHQDGVEFPKTVYVMLPHVPPNPSPIVPAAEGYVGMGVWWFGGGGGSALRFFFPLLPPFSVLRPEILFPRSSRWTSGPFLLCWFFFAL